MTLVKNHDHIITDWYMKPIASGRMINYHSSHPPNMIRNVAISFAKRVLSLSHPSFHSKNICRIEDILSRNSFPHRTIRETVRNVTYQLRHPPDPKPPDDSATYSKLTYIPVIGDRLLKRFRTMQNTVTLASKVLRPLRSTFTNMKSRVEQKIVGAIYRLKCNDCPKTYIGETCRAVETRIKEHERDLKNETAQMENHLQYVFEEKLPNSIIGRLIGRTTRAQQQALSEAKAETDAIRLSKNYKTAALAHQMTNNHSLNFESYEVLARETGYFRRKRLEAIYIQLEGKMAVNLKTDTQYLHNQTKSVLNAHKHLNQHLTPTMVKQRRAD